MTVSELLSLIENLTSNPYTIIISAAELHDDEGLMHYNNRIRNEVLDLPGIYIWENIDNKAVLYIGMAGKVNQQGVMTMHSVRKRLQASRGKDPNTNRDVLTNRYIRNIMSEQNCQQLQMTILHMQETQLPGFAEAILLNAFYQGNGILPLYNSAF